MSLGAALGGALAGAGQGLVQHGEALRKEAREKREAARRQAERQENRQWQSEDRQQSRDWQRSDVEDQRGYDEGRLAATANADRSALNVMYGGDPKFNAKPGTLGDLLLKTESAGSFDTLFGHAQRPGGKFAGVRVSQMTLDELSEFSAVNGEYGQTVKGQVGRVATPMGAGQIVGTTMRQTAKEMGLPGDTVFTPEVQLKMVDHLAAKALQGKTSIGAKRQALRGVWEGFQKVSDRELDAAITAYEQGDMGVEFGSPNADLLDAASNPNASDDVRDAARAKLDGAKTKRETKQDAQGFLRFVDDGTRVFPGVEALPSDDYGRYAQEAIASGEQPLSRIDYKKALQKNSSIEVGPDGAVRITEGGSSTNTPKTTEGEKSSAGYLSRMRAAESRLAEFSVDGPAARSVASLIIGGTDFEGLLSERQGLILQAQRDWVRAKLRKESGAVIGADEMAEEVRTYFPLPGEGDKEIAQKAEARKQAEKQFEIMSGGALALLDDGEQRASTDRERAQDALPELPATSQGNALNFSNMTMADMNGVDVTSLTLEQLDDMEARFKQLERQSR